MAVGKKGGGSWGISWAEVSDSVLDYEGRYGCRVEFGAVYTCVGGGQRYTRWLVSARALRGRAGAQRLEGYAECTVGGARGAASFPGAFIRVLIDACEDLQRRAGDKRYDRDNPAPPRS
jgi:hypothetical protein